jgi:hypothetical protein
MTEKRFSVADGPPPRRLWLLLDTDGKKPYCWWFVSEALADDFLREHNERSAGLTEKRGYGLTELVGPVPYDKADSLNRPEFTGQRVLDEEEGTQDADDE